MIIFCCSLVPRILTGMSPPDAKAATLIPPSHAETLEPLSGQLFAPAPCGNAGSTDQ